MAHYFPYDVKLRLLADSRSFVANQKARNAIVGAENLLIADSPSFLANQKARNAIVGAENLLKLNSTRYGVYNYSINPLRKDAVVRKLIKLVRPRPTVRYKSLTK